MGKLWTIPRAASELNVPATALRREAERCGLLVRFGRSLRIDPETIPELVKQCRNAQKAPASTGTNRKANGSFETLADQKLQQARQIAEKLKRPSRSTSQKGTGQLVHLARKGS